MLFENIFEYERGMFRTMSCENGCNYEQKNETLRVENLEFFIWKKNSGKGNLFGQNLS